LPIVRDGSAVAPAPPFGNATYPKTEASRSFATASPATAAPLVNTLAGLPGPAALILPMATTWLR
jgi:hypothetical protein